MRNEAVQRRTYVIKVSLEAQVSAHTKLVHLLDEYSLACPLFELTDQRCRNPSCEQPKVARNRESGLNATAQTPWLCSVMMATGVS